MSCIHLYVGIDGSQGMKHQEPLVLGLNSKLATGKPADNILDFASWCSIVYDSNFKKGQILYNDVNVTGKLGTSFLPTKAQKYQYYETYVAE